MTVTIVVGYFVGLIIFQLCIKAKGTIKVAFVLAIIIGGFVGAVVAPVIVVFASSFVGAF